MRFLIPLRPLKLVFFHILFKKLARNSFYRWQNSFYRWQYLFIFVFVLFFVIWGTIDENLSSSFFQTWSSLPVDIFEGEKEKKKSKSHVQVKKIFRLEFKSRRETMGENSITIMVLMLYSKANALLIFLSTALFYSLSS